MATKRFCDICDKQLTPIDDQPFVRELEYIPPDMHGNRTWMDGVPQPKAIAFVAITNMENHPLTDVCQGCKLNIVKNGLTPDKPVAVATLQPNMASDVPVPVTPFRLPEKPPILPKRAPQEQHTPPLEAHYEPSIPIHDQ